MAAKALLSNDLAESYQSVYWLDLVTNFLNSGVIGLSYSGSGGLESQYKSGFFMAFIPKTYHS